MADCVGPSTNSGGLTNPPLREPEVMEELLGSCAWRRPVRDLDSTFGPRTAFALESERTTRHQANRWIKAEPLAAEFLISLGGTSRTDNPLPLEYCECS